ncbi:MAG: hypothetical protein JRC66_00645 [Deltaproteobacteria bacterium]|nr:hypothetical protein [Deltaproteobacteria bacterium]
MKKTTKQRLEAAIEVAGELKPGTVTHVVVKHDPDCPALLTHRMRDCTCKPIIEKVTKQ